MAQKVYFSLNKNFDALVANEFLSARAGGIDFSRGVLGPNPELARRIKNRSGKERSMILRAYVNEFYTAHRAALARTLQRFRNDWNHVDKRFFTLTKIVFRNSPFPRGPYKAYLSIFDCNPRFLKQKSFQIYYRHPAGATYVVMHELMHFMFYRYARQNFPKYFKNANTESGFFWDIAEIFNSVILFTPPFIRLHGVRRRITYPSHRRVVKALAGSWHKHENVDEYIKDAVGMQKV